MEHEGQLLLCRRAIEPCRGLWTVPAGFLEMGESTAAGAARETWEEANARVEVRIVEGFCAHSVAHLLLSQQNLACSFFGPEAGINSN